MSKYKVMPDVEGEFSCGNCAFTNSTNCNESIKENNLPNCFTDDCYFVEIIEEKKEE